MQDLSSLTRNQTLTPIPSRGTKVAQAVRHSPKKKQTNKKTNDRLTRKKKDRIFIIFTCTGVYRK